MWLFFTMPKNENTKKMPLVGLLQCLFAFISYFEIVLYVKIETNNHCRSQKCDVEFLARNNDREAPY